MCGLSSGCILPRVSQSPVDQTTVTVLHQHNSGIVLYGAAQKAYGHNLWHFWQHLSSALIKHMENPQTLSQCQAIVTMTDSTTPLSLGNALQVWEEINSLICEWIYGLGWWSKTVLWWVWNELLLPFEWKPCVQLDQYADDWRSRLFSFVFQDSLLWKQWCSDNEHLSRYELGSGSRGVMHPLF